MRKRSIALFLVLALMLSLCAVSAVAGEEPEETPETTETAETTETTDGETGVESEVTGENGEETEEEPVYLAGPDAEEEEPSTKGSTLDEKTQKLLGKVTLMNEKLDAIAFADLEKLMRANNLQLNAIEENVLIIEDINYDELAEDLREQLNDIASMQWGVVTAPAEFLGGEYEKGKSYDQLDQAYDALRETFDAIKDGELQEDNKDVVWQLNSLEDQIVMGGEALYVALVGLEIQEGSLQRQLTAMNRTVEEMELRYNMGQISALQLSQVKAGQSSLASGLETLRMNIANYKLQLEMMIGAELTGEIVLGVLPEVTAEELEKMNLEEDLLSAKTNSYALHEAALTLEDAKEVYDDAGGDGYSRPEKYEYKKAKHTWNSAVHTYNNAIQEFELKFRSLYAQVQDCYQIWNSSLVSLASEQESFKASELKYQQGTISQNAYLDAQDSLTAAEETVKTAANDLFSMYNTYCWAVQHGILN